MKFELYEVARGWAVVRVPPDAQTKDGGETMAATAAAKKKPARAKRDLVLVNVRFTTADLDAIDKVAGGADAYRSSWVKDAAVEAAEAKDSGGWRTMGLARDLLATIADEDRETTLVTIRFEPDEVAAVEAAAKRAGMPRASWVVEAALARARKMETRAAAKLVALATKLQADDS
jgi:uncharacterized protein (DUF1778 family)